jgi:hypothetical protein
LNRATGFARAVCATTLVVSMQAGAAASLDFDKVFNDRGAPKRMHYAATYRLAGAQHRVEAWRDANQRLKRRTDDALETFVSRKPGAVEWSMTVLDLKRRIRTDVDRTNLYRIGHFTDWFSLAHSLTRPAASYTLSALPSAAVPHAVPVEACSWYALRQQSRTSKICWSAARRLALLIAAGDDDRVLWKVTALDGKPLSPATFSIDDRGFVRNDANRDIQAD